MTPLLRTAFNLFPNYGALTATAAVLTFTVVFATHHLPTNTYGSVAVILMRFCGFARVTHALRHILPARVGTAARCDTGRTPGLDARRSHCTVYTLRV